MLLFNSLYRIVPFLLSAQIIGSLHFPPIKFNAYVKGQLSKLLLYNAWSFIVSLPYSVFPFLDRKYCILVMVIVADIMISKLAEQ
jgi:hypothetical protein